MKETATVYRGARRRFFTFDAACKDLAKAAIKRKCECEVNEHEFHGKEHIVCHLHHPDRYPKILRRMTRLVASYQKRFNRD